jgi:predicted dehydrogenase
MSEPKIRVGIVGAGANTVKMHIPVLRAQAGVVVVAVANRTRESSERAARELGIERSFASWRALVESPEIDAVVIGTWPSMHALVTIAALESGKHVLCEARMAMNLAEARAMRDAARARPQLVAQVVPSPFTLRVDRTVRRLLAEGFLGDVLAVTVRAGSTFLDRDAPLHWRQETAHSGTNIMSMGIWYEELMRWVGPAARVAAMGRTFVTMRRDVSGALRPADVPEHLDVIGELVCGAQLNMQITNVAGLAGPNEARLYGSEGTLRVSGGRLFGGRRGDAELREIDVPAEEAGGWRVEEQFVRAIRGLEPVTHTTFDDGMIYMAFTEAVSRSLASGRAEVVERV